MLPTRSILPESLHVNLRAVTFVLRKAIDRELVCQLLHSAIPGHFCDNAGSRNRETDSITLYHTLCLKGKSRDIQSVNKTEGRLNGKRQSCSLHRDMSSTQNIQLINFTHLGKADTPVDLRITSQLLIK